MSYGGMGGDTIAMWCGRGDSNQVVEIWWW